MTDNFTSSVLQLNESTNDNTDTSNANVTIKAPYIWNMCVYRETPKFVLLLVQILKLYVSPVISILGFSTNMFSIVILRKSGLRKPSNILLLGMVVADSMTQLQTMNFAEIVQVLGPNYRYPLVCGWQYGDEVNYILLVCDGMFYFFSGWGQYVNTTIPVIITCERFLAVYLPMTFKNIVTIKTAWSSVVVSFLIWLPWVIFSLSLFRTVSQLPGVMLFALGFKREESLEVYILLNDYVFTVISSWVPIAFIGSGCILIGVKVKITLMQRRQLTSSKEKVPWSAKTTRTLLITCVVLFISLIIGSFLGFYGNTIPDDYFSFTQEILRFNILLNASSNFFIYISTNGKFFSISKSIFQSRKGKSVY